MKLIVVTGIPGVGKTTVLNSALGRLSEDFILINYGDQMLSVALKKKLISNRDEIRKLHPDVQKDIQREAAKAIAEEAKTDNVIVDTHCTIKTPQGYLPGLPSWVLEELKPNQFILVEASHEEISGRRNKDETRARDMDTIEEIKEHQEINRATAMAYSMFSGAIVKIIKNHDDRLEEAVDVLMRAI